MSSLAGSPDAIDTRLIALFGGTFDPVHNGHLHAARAVAKALGTRVRLMPASIPPHRPQPIANTTQRVAMLRAAVAGDARLEVDTRELERPGASYTVATLTALRAEVGADRPIAIIVGADAFAGFPQWNQWQRLFDLAHVVVLNRPGAATQDDWTNALREVVEPRLVDDAQAVHRTSAGCCLPLSITPMAISATQIRQMLARGDSPAALVPEAVLAYIRDVGLY